MIHKKHHYNIVVIVLLSIILLFVLLMFTFYRAEMQNNSNLSENTREHISPTMNFSISYPAFFELNDNGIEVSLKNEEGEIEIVRNGTTDMKPESILSNFDGMRNPISVISSQNNSLSGYTGILRQEEYPNLGVSKKTQYIFLPGTMFVLSTSSENLYDELDQVAQSFRYLGETSDN